MSETVPGGEYSGCPGSRSSTAMPCHIRLCDEFRCVPKRFANIFPKVDFPEDLGPHTSTIGALDELLVASSAIFLFHSAGETRSCSLALRGPSSEVYICFSVNGIDLAVEEEVRRQPTIWNVLTRDVVEPGPGDRGVSSFQSFPNTRESLSNARKVLAAGWGCNSMVVS